MANFIEFPDPAIKSTLFICTYMLRGSECSFNMHASSMLAATKLCISKLQMDHGEQLKGIGGVLIEDESTYDAGTIV